VRLPHIRLLEATCLVIALDRFALPPMLLAISHDLDVPLADVAGAAGAYFLAYGLTQPVWGIVGGRLGVARTLRLAVLLATLASAGTALAAGSASLILARVLAGAGFSSAIPITLFYVGATAPPHERQRGITRLMAGVALGTAAATAGAGVFAGTLGWRAAYVVTGAAGLSLWLALHRLPELRSSPTAASGLAAALVVLRCGPARLLLLLAHVEGAVVLGTLTFLPVAADRAGSGPAVAAAVTAAFGVAVLGFAPVVGAVQRRVRSATLIAAGATCAVTGCALAAVSVRPAVTVVTCVLLGAAWAAMHSTLQTWAAEINPAAGLMSVSLFATALFAGSAVAALLGGRVADAGHFPALFATAAALGVPLGVVASLRRARWGRDSPAGGTAGRGAYLYWDVAWRDGEVAADWSTPDPWVVSVSEAKHSPDVRRVLDLGCGVGRHALAFSRAGMECYGIDRSDSAIAETRDRAGREGLAIDLRVGDFQRLPYPDGFFDYVLAWNVIYHGSEHEVAHAIGEVARVLRPDGFFQTTMLSKRNVDYGVGVEVGPNCWVQPDGPRDKPYPHVFSDEHDVLRLHKGFRLLTMFDVEHRRPGSYHWQLLFERGGR
jgi:predicted MFS family arabinose efflux permease/SAM-dependent methyltransferase